MSSQMTPQRRNMPAQPFENNNKYVSKNAFTYGTSISAPLAPNASATSSFNIDGDSDFYWSKLAVHGVSGDDGTTYDAELLPEVNIIITNTTTGRQFMNQGIPVSSIAGNGRLPFILPMVTYFPAKSTIKIDYLNASDNQTFSDLYLSFIGIKAFLKSL